jgi:hypothetical protein
VAECKHTPSPNGYVAWHEWAERKAKTHAQTRCPVCGRWAVWKKPRPDFNPKVDYPERYTDGPI